MKVLVDTDPGLGLNFADVDDGLALFLMLNNDQFEIEGITTVFGNSPVDKGHFLLKKYLKLCNRLSIPHFKGAENAQVLGNSTLASKFLVNEVKEHPNQYILMALGPLTNIATALQKYDSFLDDLNKLVIMGGTLSPQTAFNPLFKIIDRRFFNKLPLKALVAEFNFFNDPQATKCVIEAETKTPRIVMGLDACCKVVFKKQHLRELLEHSHPITQFIASQIKFWYNFWLLNGRGGFFPFDTLCPIYLIEPDLFSIRTFEFTVNTKNLGGKLNITGMGKNTLSSISYGTGFKDKKAKKDFMTILVNNLQY
jgi:purine nucleosidase